MPVEIVISEDNMKQTEERPHTKYKLSFSTELEPLSVLLYQSVFKNVPGCDVAILFLASFSAQCPNSRYIIHCVYIYKFICGPQCVLSLHF